VGRWGGGEAGAGEVKGGVAGVREEGGGGGGREEGMGEEGEG